MTDRCFHSQSNSMRWGLGWGWVTPYQKVMFHVSVQFSNFSKWLYQKGKKGKSLGCVEAVSTVMVMWLLIKPFHPPRTSTVACEGAVHPPHCAATSKESNRQARADLWLDTICRPSSASICSTSSLNIMQRPLTFIGDSLSADSCSGVPTGDVKINDKGPEALS